jgi:hypothetical protein
MNYGSILKSYRFIYSSDVDNAQITPKMAHLLRMIDIDLQHFTGILNKRLYFFYPN